MFKFAPEGYPFFFIFALAAVITAVFGKPWMVAVPLVLLLFMFFFFRDPERITTENKNAFYSPADGKVILIKETVENELLNEKALEVSIFMSPFDVHVNRAPCNGVVKDVKHYPGKFLAAFKEESSLQNEHITMLLETEHGKIVVRQVAGFIARRAVCRVKDGDLLKQGQRYGIIKFSSRLDIFLPLNTQIKVKLNDKVKAGETVIAVTSEQ
ncbi:MAG: phosphatidylserine decarboxylase family protein [Thermodesulfovibrionia bacterium]|nr:phosphatidylserine decarboxylase family protein [Thermodesulfovibrionia bacterium]